MPGSDTPSCDEHVCTTCGGAIEPSAWHPVIAETDASGTLRLYPFCRPDCQDEWTRTYRD
ncbi:DUF7576 family protein [Haladaptatus sp. NG-SE-30]